IDAVMSERQAQCTLVPDDPSQITSDHGWNVRERQEFLNATVNTLKSAGIRVSLFMDFDSPDISLAKVIGADRVELYTEPYAASFGGINHVTMLDHFRLAADTAQHAGLGVNAGHDLNLHNLGPF